MAQELSQLEADWRTSRTIGVAADFVAAAAVAGESRITAAAREAAEDLLRRHPRSSNAPLARIARRVAGKHEVVDPAGFGTDQDRTSTELHRLRESTKRFPRNPLAWVELSRTHASMGNKQAAERAIRVAMGLAPNHRFVLRSFLRLALHLDEDEKTSLTTEAWDRLRRCAETKHDPWLAAAEIACAMVLSKQSKVAAASRKLLSLNDLSSTSRSELAASLGALEIDAGSERSGKRLLLEALEGPTDNAIAQVAWTDRTLHTEILSPLMLRHDLTYEARAWAAFEDADWTRSLNEARAWASDEPFSTRPAQLGTFVSSVALGDFDTAAEIARQSLRANPDDILLRNNLAFALASAGKAAEAASEFRYIRLNDTSLKPDMRIVLAATSGLIAFRQGDRSTGERLYRSAIEGARRLRNGQLETLATIYFAREARLAHLPDVDKLIADAKLLVAKNPRKELWAAFGRVQSQVSTLLERPKIVLARESRRATSLFRRIWRRVWPFGVSVS